jgi:thiamine-monophosphate kinase
MAETYTPVSKVGEFGLIDRLAGHLALKNPLTLNGIGDDAAVINREDSKVTLFSTDMLVEGIHFDLTYMPLKHLGYKAVSVNVSDICAMNGKPTHLVVSLAASNQFSVEALEEIYIGMQHACNEYGVDIVGGDTVSSLSGLYLNIAILGYAEKNEVVYRHGATANDIICLSGTLGGAYSGLLVLKRGKDTFLNDSEQRPDLKEYAQSIKKQLMPKARVDMVKLFAAHHVIPTAMIDISDGLSSEIHHICKASKVGCLINEDALPIHPEALKVAEEFNDAPVSYALSGGEDYELLFTLKPDDYEKLKSIDAITRIGEISEASAGINFKTKNGMYHPLSSKGWDSILNN